MIRVLLVDDHASFLEPLAFMFEQEPDLTVVAQAGTLTEAREELRTLSSESIDIAVVDINLPDGEGIELIEDLYTANPQCAVLILSAVVEREQLARAVEAGAAGVLHKSTRIKNVIDAARRLGAGEYLLSPTELQEMLDLAYHQRERDRESRSLLEKLTRREREVLQAFGKGLSDLEIATRLYVSSGTVRTHMVNITTKLETKSRLQALLLAARHGAVKID